MTAATTEKYGVPPATAESFAGDELRSDAVATILPPAQGAVRYLELDALRGVAALTVVFAHFSGLFNQRTMSHVALFWMAGPLQLIRAGHAAVVLFFLLSGFVLSLPAIAGRPQPYGVFLVRRFTRVYLPYFAALCLAVGADALFRRNIYVNPWFSETWSGPVSWHLVLSHVLMLGNYRWSEYNTAFWSLVYEMRVSIVFPLLAFVVLRSKKWLVFVALVLCFIVEAILSFPADSHTLFAFPAFIVGILIARDRQSIAIRLEALPRMPFSLLVVSSVALYAYAGYAVHLPRPLPWMAEPLVLVGASVLLCASFSRHSWRMFLQRDSLQWLGHVSYSMYLVHATVLFSLVHLCFGKIPLWTLLPVYLCLVFALSRIFFALVERPAMNFGRRLTKSETAQTPVSASR